MKKNEKFKIPVSKLDIEKLLNSKMQKIRGGVKDYPTCNICCSPGCSSGGI
jgi:hypothetical protein